MINLLEALNYRCLKYVHQELGAFHVLVGPNASGKSTFLDAIAFLGRFVSDGLDAAVNERTGNFNDLLWKRGTECRSFELAVEAKLPDLGQMAPLFNRGIDTIRYEVAIGFGDANRELLVLSEQILLGKNDCIRNMPEKAPTTLSQSGDGWEALIEGYHSREAVRSAIVMSEIEASQDGQIELLFPKKRTASIISALDKNNFPASSWLFDVMQSAKQRLNLDVHAMQKPCAPGVWPDLEGDGSNLARVVQELTANPQEAPQKPGSIQITSQIDPRKYAEWIEHIKTAIPDIAGIRVVERPEDRHLYLMVKHENGMEVPSWMLSEGTLRLLALTLIPYVSTSDSIWLVEEPENGIHPLNLETVMQSLSSVYDGQVLVSTHSPAILALTAIENILVFQNSEDQGVTIIPGNEHPRLKHWMGEPSLGTLFASGVLG